MHEGQADVEAGLERAVARYEAQDEIKRLRRKLKAMTHHRDVILAAYNALKAKHP